MKTTFRTSLLALAIMLLISLNSSAQPDFANPDSVIEKEEIGNPQVMSKLTEEQKASIKKLRISHKQEMLTLRNQLGEKRAQLKTLETSAKPEMQAIYNTIDEIGTIHTEMQKKNAKLRQEIRAMLTDEQRVIFDERGMKGQGRDPRKGKGPGKGTGKGKQN